MAAGDTMKEFDFFSFKGTPKASTAISKGDVLVNWGNGYEPAFQSAKGPFYVALEDASSSASPSDIRILKRGCVKLTAESAVDEGDWVVPASTNAQVDPLESPLGTTKLGSIIGVAMEDISASSTGKVLIGY